jgi:hypothetical protein
LPPVVDPGVAPPTVTPPTETVRTETIPKKDPELEVFTMTITTGNNVERVRFVRKPGDTWSADGPDPSSPTPPSDKRPETRPTAPPRTAPRNG